MDGVFGWLLIKAISHLNSVDKNSDGDYLVSARFTDAVYLISGKDGRIIWTLGGPNSTFVQDFNFFRQHDARFITHNETHTIISLLNNASDEDMRTEDVSSAMYVLLDRTASPMQASLIARYNRPDNALSRLRGNVQTLPNGNVFVGWSEQGYHSEFSSNGSLAMEARFITTRYSSYRSYKSEWTGRPSEPPALKSFVYGTSVEDASTVVYVSWNGATDVASYRFFAKKEEHKPSVPIGSVERSGFESMFVVKGYLDWVSADALDSDKNVLGKSDVKRTVVPEALLSTNFKDGQLIPQEPTPVHTGDSFRDRLAAYWDFSGVLPVIEYLVFFFIPFGVLGGCLVSLIYSLIQCRCQKERKYEEVPRHEDVEGEGEGGTEMDRLAPS